MGQMTVQQFNIKTDEQGNPKKDNYGNTQMMIKFEESPETVYKAVKDPSTITAGKVMYGTVVEGQYGFKFQADPYDRGGTPPQGTGHAPQTAPQPAQATVASDELLTLVKDNNRMLKALVGETESTNETGDDLPPAEAYDEPDFGG